MKSIIIGILLIVLGAVALAFPAISYQTEEKILEIGPIEATAERTKQVPLPLWLGGAAIAGGILLLVTGARRPRTGRAAGRLREKKEIEK